MWEVFRRGSGVLKDIMIITDDDDDDRIDYDISDDDDGGGGHLYVAPLIFLVTIGEEQGDGSGLSGNCQSHHYVHNHPQYWEKQQAEKMVKVIMCLITITIIILIFIHMRRSRGTEVDWGENFQLYMCIMYYHYRHYHPYSSSLMSHQYC